MSFNPRVFSGRFLLSHLTHCADEFRAGHQDPSPRSLPIRTASDVVGKSQAEQRPPAGVRPWGGQDPYGGTASGPHSSTTVQSLCNTISAAALPIIFLFFLGKL